MYCVSVFFVTGDNSTRYTPQKEMQLSPPAPPPAHSPDSSTSVPPVFPSEEAMSSDPLGSRRSGMSKSSISLDFGMRDLNSFVASHSNLHKSRVSALEMELSELALSDSSARSHSDSEEEKDFLSLNIETGGGDDLHPLMLNVEIRKMRKNGPTLFKKAKKTRRRSLSDPGTPMKAVSPSEPRATAAPNHSWESGDAAVSVASRVQRPSIGT